MQAFPCAISLGLVVRIYFIASLHAGTKPARCTPLIGSIVTRSRVSSGQTRGTFRQRSRAIDPDGSSLVINPAFKRFEDLLIRTAVAGNKFTLAAQKAANVSRDPSRRPHKNPALRPEMSQLDNSEIKVSKRIISILTERPTCKNRAAASRYL